MKSSIILLFVCLMMNVVVRSQSTTQKTTGSTSSAQFGIKAGVNISNVHVEGTEFDSRIGFHVGALAHIHLTTNFAVQPELVYSSQGAEDQNTKYKEDYINVPVLLQYMTHNGFRIQSGPQVGFLIAAKSKTNNVELDYKDLLNTVDFAWSFGASYLSKTGLGLDVRYNLGISNRTESDASPETKHRVWQIGVFYQFMQ